MDIAICISSYKRPNGLKRLLDSLEAMNYSKKNIFVCIADNDGEKGEGLAFVEKHRNDYSFDIIAAIEPRPGISHARNRSLTLARDSKRAMDYVAFVDDDSIVSPQWVADLVHTASTYGADCVCGKMEPRFETTPDDEILYADFFVSGFASPATGTIIHDAGTNNVMVSKRIFDDFGYEAFDPALSLTGGEDSDLFARITRKNYKMVQCSSAVVYEIYPADRLNRKWILNRYFRSGSTYAYIFKKYESGRDYFFATIRKILKLPFDYLAFVIKPSLTNQCRLKNTLGFLNYAFKNHIFEEYGRRQ